MITKNIRSNILYKSKKEAGITLTVLAITIVILMLMAGVGILTFSDTNIIGHTEESVNTYYNDKMVIANEVDQMAERFDNSISKLSQAQVDLIRNKIKTGELYTVNYEPQAVNSTVTVGGAYNGGLEDQTFNQTDTGAKGSNKMNWYVLSADVNQVNLVSSVSNKQIGFKDTGGYDNCLYFLNQIAQTLFLNENFGVTADRAHAFRLTDIKTAAEQVNGSGYSFDSTFFGDAILPNQITTLGYKKVYDTNTKYPQIYGTSSDNVVINNPIYDEKVDDENSLKIGDLIQSTSTTANSINIRNTACWYNDNITCKAKLGYFGNTGVVNELFNEDEQDCCLATKSIMTGQTCIYYDLRSIKQGCLSRYGMCDSVGYSFTSDYAFRIVVSVPASHINVGNDGTVTLK